VTFREGRAQQTSLTDFPVLGMEDVPEIQVHFVPSRENPVGLGEPPVPALAPAVLNALHAATGRRLRRLPVLPGDLA
jgi:isoquinoline 1-oxidoreductase beta subunit